MAYLKRDVDAAIEWSRNQITNPSQDWYNKCQSHVRQAYGVGAWAPSAWDAWNSIPSAHRNPGSNPAGAPRGAALYYRGGQYGHVAIAIGKTTNDKCLSNDYVRRGRIDETPRTFPRWGITYVGWSFWTPYGELAPGSTALWDGTVPPQENVDYAEDTGEANKAAWRLACRLHDLGHYSGTPQPCYTQQYPEKAVTAFQKAQGWEGSGKYGQKTHAAVFPG